MGTNTDSESPGPRFPTLLSCTGVDDEDLWSVTETLGARNDL